MNKELFLKKMLVLLTAFAIVFAGMGISQTSPTYATTANPITVYVTVVTNDGTSFDFGIDKKAVEVKDLDESGDFNLDEVFTAVHEQNFSGGVAGYGTNNEWGSITKLWGNDSGWFSTLINNVPNNTGITDKVNAGDYVTAYIYLDQNYPSKDLYTYFEKNSYSVDQNKEVSLQLHSGQNNAETFAWEVIQTPANTKVTLYNQAGETVDTAASDADGKVSFKIKKAGTYKAVCSTGDGNTDNNIVISSTTVNVKAVTSPQPQDDQKDQTNDNNDGNNTDEKITSPKTGDAQDMMLWTVIAASAFGLAAVVMVYRKKKTVN